MSHHPRKKTDHPHSYPDSAKRSSSPVLHDVPHAPGGLIELQSLIGNAAVQRWLASQQQSDAAAIQRSPTPAATYQWLGQIQGAWSAALRKAPHKDEEAPHDNTLADLPRDTYVRVLGKEKGWLRVEVDIDGKTLTGYVSHELVKYVRDGTFDFSGDADVVTVMTLQHAFLTLKRAETNKANNPAYKPDSKQADLIQQAMDKLAETKKYIVDPLTYQVTFDKQSGSKIQVKTIEDFILFVETVERQYPSASPKEIAGEIRQMWFSDQNWDVLVSGQGISSGGTAQDIESEPNPIATMFDMKDLAPQKGGKQLDTPMGRVDIGHVMAGIDAALNGSPSELPAKFVRMRTRTMRGDQFDYKEVNQDALLKYNTLKDANKGDPRDFATWAGDLGQAYAEYLAARWVKKDESASFKSFIADKAPEDELRGDIHGYIALEVWKQVPPAASPTGRELKISNILRDMYMTSKETSPMKDASYQQLVEKVSGESGSKLRAFIIERTLAFGKPWFAKKAYEHRGYWDSDGWTGEGILESGMAEFGKVHEKNEAEARDENKLGGLIQSVLDMMKEKLP